MAEVTIHLENNSFIAEGKHRFLESTAKVILNFTESRWKEWTTSSCINIIREVTNTCRNWSNKPCDVQHLDFKKKLIEKNNLVTLEVSDISIQGAVSLDVPLSKSYTNIVRKHVDQENFFLSLENESDILEL